MRRFFIILLIFLNLDSIAQINKGCNFYGENAIVSKKDICNFLNNFNSISDADKIVDNILAQIGLKRNFVIIECPNYLNASAVNIKGKNNEEIRYLIYGGDFLKRLNNETKDWGAYAILAHEIGHHLNGHTLNKEGSKPPTELEADEFSGFVLNRLGATLEEAQSVFKIGSSEKASKTHPAKKDRLLAVEKGWNSSNELTSINTVVRIDTVIVNNTIVNEKIVTKTDTLVISKKDTLIIFRDEKQKDQKTKFQIGIDIGSLNIFGDIKTKYFWNALKPFHTIGTNLSVQIPLYKNSIFLKLGYLFGNSSGYNSTSSSGYWGHFENPYSKLGYVDMPVYYNYRTSLNQIYLEMVLKPNKSKIIKPIISLGGGLLIYNTMVDALNGSNRYSFGSVPVGPTTPKANKTFLRGFFDGVYETESEKKNSNKLYTTSGILNFGVGIEVRLNRKFNFVFINKYAFSNDDLIDGQQWQDRQISGGGIPITSSQTGQKDKINFTSLGVIYSFNKKH